MNDQPACGYRGDPPCMPPNCQGACDPSKEDTRPAQPSSLVEEVRELTAEEVEQFNRAWQRLRPWVEGIGYELVKFWPPVAHEKDKVIYGDEAMTCYIPAEGSQVIAELLTAAIAEILQAWLDAGSEREVTMEELGPHIDRHVRGWDSRS